MSFSDIKDPQLRELLKLRLHCTNSNMLNDKDINKIDKAIQQRIDDLCGLLDKHTPRLSKFTVKGCDCGTSNHAHSINCPQHPGNLLPSVDYK